MAMGKERREAVVLRKATGVLFENKGLTAARPNFNLA